MKRFRMKAYLLFTLILGVFILPGCGGDAGNGHWDQPGTGISLSAPTVLVVVPAVNAPAVPINTKLVTAAFSKAMDPATLTTSSFTLSCNGTPITGGGAVTYLDAGFVATLPLPAGTDLPGNALCTARITTAATALDGNALASIYEWNFTTALVADTALPQVLSTVPETTTPGPTAAISNTPIQALFNEDMDAASITAPGTMTVTEGPGNTLVAGAAIPVTYDVATRTATFTPLNPLTDGVTYTVTIKGTGLTPATDVAFNALAGNSTLPLVANDYVWSFTPTAAVVTILPGAVCPVDAGPAIPTVTMSDPTSGNLVATTSTVGVANNGKLITATFSLEMDPTTIASATAPLTFTIKETLSGTSVAGTVTMDATNKIATFTTSAALQPGFEYTASITTDAMSAGIPPTAIACPYEWNFTTVFPAATGLAPVNMAGIESFGVLGGLSITLGGGPASTTGFRVDGDVGVSPGNTCNGCDSTTVTGVISAANAVAAAAKVALVAAYDDAIGRTVDLCTLATADLTTGPTAACNLGINGTFQPGLYWSATNISIPVGGTITLDAMNDPNAVFIFQSESTIITNANSHIILANLANANNVFWVAKSSATIGGTGADFAGTVLALEDFTVNEDTQMLGRALARNGNVTVQDLALITVPTP